MRAWRIRIPAPTTHAQYIPPFYAWVLVSCRLRATACHALCFCWWRQFKYSEMLQITDIHVTNLLLFLSLMRSLLLHHLTCQGSGRRHCWSQNFEKMCSCTLSTSSPLILSESSQALYSWRMACSLNYSYFYVWWQICSKTHLSALHYFQGAWKNFHVIAFVSKSISPNQFGFLHKRSTLQLLTNNTPTDIDFKKAFDSVAHNELLYS